MSLDTSNQGDNIGITPIHMAIKTGHMDIVQYLAGLTDKYNPSALDIHFAISYSHLDIVKFLVDFADEPRISLMNQINYNKCNFFPTPLSGNILVVVVYLS